jgi:hypothetical protein
MINVLGVQFLLQRYLDWSAKNMEPWLDGSRNSFSYLQLHLLSNHVYRMKDDVFTY